MTPAEQHGLLVILGDVGQLPSQINAAHAIVAAKADSIAGASPADGAARATILQQNAIAESANGKIGGTTGAFEQLKAAILAIPTTAPPVEPPVIPPSGPPITIGPGLVSPPLQPWELRRLIGAGDAIYWMGVTAAGQIGNALGSGSFTLLGAVLDQPPAAGVEPAWQTSGTGLHAPLPIKVGQWYVWKFTGTASQEMRPQLQA